VPKGVFERKKKPLSEKQLAHLKFLNSSPKTLASRFQKGRTPEGQKYFDVPRDSWGTALKTCAICETSLISMYSKSGKCRKCAFKLKRKTNKRIRKDGYVYEKDCRYPEHIRIAEKILGRMPKSDEVVHHIDFDRTNNSHDNLLICNRDYHIWLHQEYGRQFVRRILCPQSL